MTPLPEVALTERPGGRLEDRAAIVTGGDSGIGHAVAVAFARGAPTVAILYLDATTPRRRARWCRRRAVAVDG